jgi:hypothetical protein
MTTAKFLLGLCAATTACSSTTGTTGDAGVGCTLDATYTLGVSNGLNPVGSFSTFAPPFSFTYEVTNALATDGDAGFPACMPPIPECRDSVFLDAADIVADVAHPDVQRALAQATPPVYGESAVADAGGWRFRRADGRGFDLAGVGAPACAVATATCTPLPHGVQRLVMDLQAFINQELNVFGASSCPTQR